MSWHIEYTNSPWLKKGRRKVLEREVAKAIHEIEHLLQSREDGGTMLGDTDLDVESTWVKDVQKHHIAVCDFKGDAGRWVASIVFGGRATMGVEEVKDTLRRMGLGEYSLYGLGVTNETTVSKFLAELEENLNKADREEWAKKVDDVNLKFLEGFLEKGITKFSDGLLDALRKIEHAP